MWNPLYAWPFSVSGDVVSPKFCEECIRYRAEWIRWSNQRWALTPHNVVSQLRWIRHSSFFFKSSASACHRHSRSKGLSVYFKVVHAYDLACTPLDYDYDVCWMVKQQEKGNAKIWTTIQFSCASAIQGRVGSTISRQACWGQVWQVWQFPHLTVEGCWICWESDVLCSEVCFESLVSDLGPRDKAVVHTPQQAKRSVCARCVRNYHVRLRSTIEPTANALTLSAFSLRHLSENSWDTRSDDECFALASRLKRDHKRGLPSAADRRPNDICDRRLGIEGNTCSTKAKDQVEAYCQGYKLLKQIRLYARGLVLMSLVRSLSELFPAHEALHCTLGYSRSVDPEHSEPQDCSSYRLFLSQMTLFFGILGVRVGPIFSVLGSGGTSTTHWFFSPVLVHLAGTESPAAKDATCPQGASDRQ